jgi:hypothetical protein
MSASNGQLFDVPGRTQSPYTEDTLFVVSPVINKVTTNNVSFILSTDRIVQNVGSFQSISIDFGTGFQAITLGQTISVSLSPGMNRPTIKVQFSNGKVLKCRFEIEAPPAPAPLPAPLSGGPDLGYDENDKSIITPNITSDINHIITADRAYLGGNATAEVIIYFACTDKKLRKPLLVLDGFNSNPNSDAITPDKFIKFFNSYINTPVSANLDRAITRDLRLEGYDLIFVNWKSEDGRDYLQRYAYLLQKILARVNIEKAANGSIEKNVIIGLSMGGPIAKYALRDLETTNPTAVNGVHDVKLLLTYDSPMQGANIPLGFQFLIKDLGQNVLGGLLGTVQASLRGGLKTLNSPAARQLLTYQALDPTPKTPALFTSFYNELNNFGALQKCEYKTLSNGSLIGTSNFTGGKQILGGTFFVPPILAVGVYLKLDVRTLPENSGAPVLIYKRTLLTFNIPIPTPPTFIVNVQDVRPLDGAPGGTTDLIQQLDGVIPGMKSGRYDDGAMELLNTTFIPVVSALDVKSPERFNVYFNVSNEQVLIDLQFVPSMALAGSRSNNPFDVATFLDPVTNRLSNQIHVGLTYRTTGFLLYELITSDDLRTTNPVSLSNRTYNLGKSGLNFPTPPPAPGSFRPKATNNIIDYTLNVENTGQLWVNRNGKIGFTDVNTAPNNANNTNYTLIIRKAEGCKGEGDFADGTVNVRNGGILKVADGSTSNQAGIRIRNGGTLRIQSGGYLIVERSNTSIDVENGGKLILESNSSTNLLGLGSKIVVKNGGQLIINGNTLVNLTALTSSIIIETGGSLVISGVINCTGSGFFRFEQSNFFTLANNATLRGAGKNNTLIKIANGATLAVIDQFDLRIENASVVSESGVLSSSRNIWIRNRATFAATDVIFDGLSLPNQAAFIEVDNATT